MRALNGEIPGEWSEPVTGSTGSTGNAAPEFDAGLPTALTVAENTGTDSDIGAPMAASDSDGDTLTYLLDGPGRHAFSIDADSGQLRTRAALDHESKDAWSLDVQVRDDRGGADSLALKVNIADVDERPGQPAPPWVFSTVEDTMSLDVRWSAPDADGGPAISGYDVQYRTDADAEWVDHVPDAGSAATGTRTTIADLEQTAAYEVRVRARNGELPGEWSPSGHGNTGDEDNNGPQFADDSATRSVPEDSEAGDPVGAAVTATDADRDRLTYYLEGADADRFDIDPQTGQLRTRAALDFETQAAHAVTVVANDGNGGADTIEITVEVIDVQEDQASLAPAAPTRVTLGRQLRLGSGNEVDAQITLQWQAAATEEIAADDISWFEFRLGRYPESANGQSAPFQCAGDRAFQPDGWLRIPDSGPAGANAGSYRFGAPALGCHALADTFELRAQVRAVFAAGEGASPMASAPSTEARMRDEAPRVLGTWLDTSELDTLGAGDELVLTVAFTEPVRVTTVDGSPTLAIAIGEATRQAGFASAAQPPVFRSYGSGHIGRQLRFGYRVQDGDDLESGIVVPANAIALSNGASIVDATGPAGHAADLRHPATTISEGTTVVATSVRESVVAAFEPDTVPAAHDGDTPFTVQVSFDESTSTDTATDGDRDGAQQDDETTSPPDLPGLALSEEAFLVTGGRIAELSQVVQGENHRWAVRIEPAAMGDVSVSLGPSLDCADAGAVCTEDGRRLANSLHAVVKGPPALSVTDSRVEEAPDATIDFAVTLSRPLTESVSVEYATSDGTAVAGEDYTETSGTLTFEVGEIARTISVPVTDDAHDDDGETFTLTLSEPSGGNAYLADDTATGTIRNADPMPKAWLARFGRTVGTHVVEALQGRLHDGPRETHVTLGGIRVNDLFGPWDPDAAQHAGGMAAPPGGFAGSNLLSGTRASDDWWGAPSPFGTPAFPGRSHAGGGFGAGHLSGGLAGSAVPGGGPAGAGLAGVHGPATNAAGVRGSETESPALRDILMGSSFFYSSADAERDADTAEAEGLGTWSAWGSTASTRFRGADGPLSIDGQVDSLMLGADAAWNRWLAGVLLAHSDGAGGFVHETATGGAVTSTLTSVHPFAQYSLSERTSVWGTLGYGVGGLSLTPAGSTDAVDTDLRMSMAAVGGRGVLSVRAGDSGSFELALRSDLMWTETQSGASQNLLSATGTASRLRLILEGSGSLPLGNGAVLTPTLEAGLRYDAGDAETGAGLEVGGGLGYGSGRFSLQLDGRALVAHEDTEYREWGYSTSVRYEPGAEGRGLNLSLGSAWGAAQSGVQSLWSQADASALVPGQAPMHAAQRFQGELGYGLLGPKRRVSWTPYLAADAGADASQAFRLGVRLTSGDRLEVHLELGRRDTGREAPEHAFQLEGSVRW